MFIYYENINNCVKLQKLQKFTTKYLWEKVIFYERNSDKTQWYRVHKGRHHKDD